MNNFQMNFKMNFKDFYKLRNLEMELNEGGNVTQINYKTGEETRQERIPIQKIGVDNFRKRILETFKKLNRIFEQEHGIPLWIDETILENGYLFNGSTSYIMDPKYIGSEIEVYKPEAGDIDIMIPENLGKKLFKTLDSLLGKEVVKGVIYKGSNRTPQGSIGQQINSVFLIDFGEVSQFQQVDFELQPFQGQKPTEWQKFSYSSSFDDQKAGLKGGVLHKYLLRSIVGGQSVRDDIIIQTPQSTPEKIKFKKRGGQAVTQENMMKFSVQRGIRVQFEPMYDQKGKMMYYSGPETGNKRVQILKEIPTNQSTYKTEIQSMFQLMFGNPENDKDIRQMSSYTGLVQLMNKYLDRDSIERTNRRFQELMWGKGQQELEREQPTWDFEIKNPGYQYFIKKTKQKDLSKGLIDDYYKNYRV